MFKNDIAQIFGADLHTTGVAQLSLNGIDDLGLFLVGNVRSLSAFNLNAAIQLFTIEHLARTIGLDNDDGIVAQALIRRETVTAFEAFATTPDGIELVGRTRVDYLGFWMAANGTAHSILRSLKEHRVQCVLIIHAEQKSGDRTRKNTRHTRANTCADHAVIERSALENDEHTQHEGTCA